jgi:hypothetical protein
MMPDANALKHPVYFLDIRKRTAARDTTVFSKNSKYYIFEPSYRDVIDFPKMSFRQKRAAAERVRNTLNEFERLKEFGIPFSNYSEIVPTRIARAKREAVEVKEICVRRYDVCKNSFSLDYLKCSSIGNLDKKKYCYAIMTSPSIHRYKSWAALLEQGGISVYFIYPNNEKYLKGSILNFEDYIKTLKPEKMSHVSDSHHYHGNETPSHYDTLREYTFPNITEDDKKFIEKVKSFSYRNMPDDFLKLFPVSQRMKDLRSVIQENVKKYPLIRALSKYSSHYTKKDVNHYINLISKEASNA